MRRKAAKYMTPSEYLEHLRARRRRLHALKVAALTATTVVAGLIGAAIGIYIGALA